VVRLKGGIVEEVEDRIEGHDGIVFLQ